MKMKRIISIALCAILALTMLASCNIVEDLKNAVVYPEAYSITYEITDADGIITTVTKTVDANGNVYIQNADEEKLYINENGSYYLYEKNEEGNFETLGYVKYTAEAVENATSQIKEYAEESKSKFIPTAKLDGEGEVVGRSCEIYKIGVGGENNGAYFYYYVDVQTGICLKVEARNTALGSEVEYDGETFVCTEFITENVEDLSNKIAK